MRRPFHFPRCAALLLLLASGPGDILRAGEISAPELIYSGDSATAIGGNSTHLFIAFSGFSPETCSLQPDQETPLMLRMGTAGLPLIVVVDTLIEGCTASIDAGIADETHVYYQRSDTKIYRMPAAGGPEELIVDESTGGGHLTADDTHVYWGTTAPDTVSIFRAPKGGGPVVPIASIDTPGHFVRQLRTDATHVYWAEGKIGSGAIRRAPKAGGAVQTLADASDGIDNAAFLDLDDTHVYWGELRPKWVSDYTYRALLAKQGVGGGAPVDPPLDEMDDALVVSALVDSLTGAAELERMHVLPGTFFGAEKLAQLDAKRGRLVENGSQWALELVDRTDQVLASYDFQPLASSSEAGGQDAFILPVRREPATAGIALRYRGEIAAERAMSPSPPEVTLVAPAGGETFPGGFTVEWTSSDPDRGELLHDVFYSPDLGASWYVLAQDVERTEYTVASPESIPGSDGAALVRVTASDGFRTSFAVSPRPFTVGNRSPVAYITQPQPDAVLGFGDVVVLRGGAQDAEEGELTGGALSWFVDGQPAGEGEEAFVSGLAIGKYTALLRARDSEDAADTAEVEFFLVQRSCTLQNPGLEIVFSRGLIAHGPRRGGSLRAAAAGRRRAPRAGARSPL